MSKPKKIADVVEDAAKAALDELRDDLREIVSQEALQDPFQAQRSILPQIYARVETELFKRLNQKLKKYTTEIKVGSHVAEIIKLIKSGD